MQKHLRDQVAAKDLHSPFGRPAFRELIGRIEGRYCAMPLTQFVI